MRAIWLLLGLSLTAASACLTWYGIAESRAHAPTTFVQLVQLGATLCGIGGTLLWGLRRRKTEE